MKSELNGKQRRYLRAMAHGASPIVHLGKAGVTEALLGAVNQALLDHELIKVRVLEECPVDRKEAAALMSDALKAELVQVLGRSVLLYRKHPEEPTIVLPHSKSN
jgi:RNA-binding protein